MIKKRMWHRTKKLFRHRFNTTSILILSFCALIAIPMVLVSVIYYANEKTSIEETSLQYENQIFDDLERDFERLLSQYGEAKYEITSQFLSLDIDEINYDALRTEDVEKIKLLENLLQSIRRVTTDVTNIYVYSTEDARAAYSSTFAFDKSQLGKTDDSDAYDSGSEWRILRNHEPAYSFGNKTASVYSFTSGLIDSDFNGKFDFFLQIDTDSSYFIQRFETVISEDTDYLAVRKIENGDIIYEQASGRKEDYQQLCSQYNGQENITQRIGDSILVKRSLISLGLEVVKVSTPDTSEMNSALFQVMVVVAGALLAALALAILITSSIMRPFDALLKSTLNEIGNSSTQLKHITAKSGNRDIVGLAQNFNQLIDRINELVTDTVNHEQEKRNLEIKMLQTQISPHFLYNTLNSLKWMAILYGQPAIADAIVALVDLLEFCFKNSKNYVRLEREIEFLQNYSKIQNIRNGRQIQVEFDIPLELKKAVILKFSFQPSVENAFVHAFPGSQVEHPKISVSCREENGSLVTVIRDNGVGYDTSKVVGSAFGIGIKNVDDRIKLTYGNAYGQTIKTKPGEWVEVIIRQPLVLSEEEWEEKYV